MTALLATLCVALSVALVISLLKLWRLEATAAEIAKEQVNLAIKEFRKRSERTRVGTTVEQLIPLVKELPFDPSDMRILSGGPVDYIVFDGLCDGEVRQLVFLDVKTGTGKVNQAQKQVRRCAEAGLVSFALFEVDERGQVRYRPSLVDH
ncbi:MAG: Holliday junction resolvase-like protein [Actinomycetota bacterium]